MFKVCVNIILTTKLNRKCSKAETSEILDISFFPLFLDGFKPDYP